MTCDAEQTARITAVTADLAWITESWPDLYQLRLPGARRRTTRRPLTRAARQRADEQARVEKADRRPGEHILGASPAPMHVGVLDTLASILTVAVELSDRIGWNAGVTDPEPPSTGYDFDAIDRHLVHAARHLNAATEVDPQALVEAELAAKRMRVALERALTEIVDGQVLSTVCAWCHGTTTHTPAGGERTLTVRLVAGEPLIVCLSDVCEPPDEDCRVWLFGRPAWREHEWEWLAKRLGA